MTRTAQDNKQMGLGIALGTALGLALGNLAIGVALGVTYGSVMMMRKRRSRSSDDQGVGEEVD